MMISVSTTHGVGKQRVPSRRPPLPTMPSLLPQLRLRLPASYRTLATHVSSPQTYTEKIVQKYTVGLSPGTKVKQGDFVSIKPENVMTHDNTGAVMKK
jgi:hypothetical protein